MIKIGYSGTLGYFDPRIKERSLLAKTFKSLFWTYRHNIELSYTRSPYYFFRAIEQLKLRDKELSTKLKIELWGNIDNRNNLLINEFCISDVVSIDKMLPKLESESKLMECDIFFLPMELPAKEHGSLFIPGKVFEYLFLRKPIFMLDEDSDCANIVRNSGLGIFANPTEVSDIAEKLEDIISEKREGKSRIKRNDVYIDSLSFKYRAREMAMVFDEILI